MNPISKIMNSTQKKRASMQIKKHLFVKKNKHPKYLEPIYTLCVCSFCLI